MVLKIKKRDLYNAINTIPEKNGEFKNEVILLRIVVDMCLQENADGFIEVEEDSEEVQLSRQSKQ